jgi:hypothetical protein
MYDLGNAFAYTIQRNMDSNTVNRRGINIVPSKVVKEG